jgi:hypothetical protein
MGDVAGKVEIPNHGRWSALVTCRSDVVRDFHILHAMHYVYLTSCTLYLPDFITRAHQMRSTS